MKSWIVRSLVLLTLLTLIVIVGERFDPFPQGLRAEYFRNAAWTAPSTMTVVESRPSSLHLVEAWGVSLPHVFSAVWSGSVVAPREGTYTFATLSDDGSAVYVDGEQVVDNGGTHPARLASGSIHLTPGSHELLIRYVQTGGELELDFQWAREGSGLETVPTWALRSRRKAAPLARLVPSIALTLVTTALEWVWLLVGATGLVVATRAGLIRLRRYLQGLGVWRSLRWILAGSLALDLMAIWWGLPGLWVPIELTPSGVLAGLTQHFSHGWFEAYPPFHYYVLAAAISPILLLQPSGWVTMYGGLGYPVAVLLCRLVSVAAAAGIVISTSICGVRAFGRRAGVFAAAIVALIVPFLYYAKTANVDVPYLFWWSLSSIFYLRMLDDGRLRDYALFGACAALAVCTKDQAYALYLLAPPAIVYRSWRRNRQGCVSRSFWRALFDAHLWTAAVTGAALFAVCQNLWFNFAGFADHVRWVVGPGNEAFRLFQPTIPGRLALLRVTFRLIQESMGWPLFVTALAGIVVAAAKPQLRRVGVWLALPVIGYYLGFIDVILYNYDRFVLPICMVLALFGGLALDRFLAPKAAQGWRLAATAAIFAYTILYAGTVDVLMATDSRYAVQDWMRAHVGPDEIVAFTGVHEILPTLDEFKRIEISSVAELERERPAYVVFNADYAHSVAEDTDWGRLLFGLERQTLGYRLAFRFRQKPPWPWLPGAHQDLVGPRESPVVFSILQFVNPTIEVFRRESPPAIVSTSGQ